MTVVVRLPGISLDSDLTFRLSSGKDKKKTLQADTENIVYKGEEASDHKYCLAIKDKTTGKMRLVQVPLMDVRCLIKDKMDFDKSQIRQEGILRTAQRTSLGQAFGTKKAKTAITDLARNKLDADMLDGMEGAVLDTMKESTSHLPSQEERQKTLAVDRPIPPHNLETSDLSLVYPVDQLAPQSLMDVLPLDAMLAEETSEARAAHLAVPNSDFINMCISNVIEEGVHVRQRVQLLIYANYLMATYLNKRCNNRAKLFERLGNPPGIVVDTIIHEFASAKPSAYGLSKEANFVFDPRGLDRLLSYFIVAILHCTDFRCDINPLSHELSIKTSRLVELFRGLGCSVRTLTVGEAKQRGLSSAAASSYKVAKLSAPLVLGEPVKRKRSGGRR